MIDIELPGQWATPSPVAFDTASFAVWACETAETRMSGGEHRQWR